MNAPLSIKYVTLEMALPLADIIQNSLHRVLKTIP